MSKQPYLQKAGRHFIFLITSVLLGCSTTHNPADTDQKIYVIIDDAGPGIKQIEPFLKLPVPLTVAVMPGYPATVKTAHAVHHGCRYKELILHQPMEAENARIDPGPDALYMDTPPDEIHRILQNNIAQVPGAKGMNNHMGSRITQDRTLMNEVILFCKTNQLFFIDSLTSPDSVAGSVAREQGVPTAHQNIFLDNSKNPDAIRKQFLKGMQIAREQGSVIMIGHAWSPKTAAVIREMIPVVEENGYSFHTISDIFK